MIDRIVDGFSFLPLAPMMHAAAQWTTLSWLFAGGKVTLMPGPLDPPAVWQAVQDEAVNALTVVGDAVGRPLVAAWEAEPDRWDVSALFSISNGGAPMSAPLKARLAELFPGRVIVDGFGSSEAGVQGSQRSSRRGRRRPARACPASSSNTARPCFERRAATRSRRALASSAA